MANETTVEAPEEKKSSTTKVILLAVGTVVALSTTIGGTLFLTGVFSKKTVDAEEVLQEKQEDSAEHANPAAAQGKPDASPHTSGKNDNKSGAKGGALQKKPLPADAQTRFERSYIELDDKKALIANVANSRKVMQISLSLMTQYDDRVLQSVEKHRAALRSKSLDVLRLVTEADLDNPDFRSELAQRLRDKINAELERLENFGGIEEVFFTAFVYQ